MRPLAVLFTALPILLSACAPTPPLQARGNEPGWTLRLADGRATLVSDYGATIRTAVLPAPEIRGDATIYRLHDPELTIRVADRLCHDDMTGMPYPRSVTLSDPDRVLHGCGGTPEALLAGRWQMTEIDGSPAPAPASLTFAPGGKVSGHGPCSAFVGQVAMTGEGLRLTSIAATPQMCQPDQSAQETRYYAALNAVTRFDIAADGALVLLAGDTPKLRARKD